MADITLLKTGYSNRLRTAFFGFCGSNFLLFIVRNFALFSMYRFILQFPKLQGQNLCLYKLFKKTLRAQVLTHSWSLTGCLPPVGRPCRSQRYGCCSSHPGAGSRASGLCDCTHTQEILLVFCSKLLHFSISYLLKELYKKLSLFDFSRNKFCYVSN